MNYRGKKAAFYTLGCKLNFSETSAIAASLKELGFEHVGFEEPADLYVINTCSVTSQADKASRNIIRQAIRRNPAAMVIVTGCYSQLKPEIIKQIEGVDLILGTEEKSNIPCYLDKLEKKGNATTIITPGAKIKNFHKAYSIGERTRSFLKIQDGCDYFCAFCTIPFARGRSRNDSIKNTLAEAQKSVNNGFKEIVLTGVNIGDFGKSTDENFTDLLKELENIKGLKRLRLGSIEPNLLKDEIIELAASSKVIMPHFHIPLQSGSEELLKIIKRRYTPSLFEYRIQRIRQLIPHAFIGADVISGINGETDKMFRESYNFIKNLEISQLHAFTYSERPGTQALNIPHEVNLKERKRRTQLYMNLSEKKLKTFYNKHLGEEHLVLFESKNDNGKMSGFTENYIKVEVPFRESLINRIEKIKLQSILVNGHIEGNYIN